MRGNMGALLKQAARVQENIKRLQHELEHLEVTGSASGNLVQVTMTCKHALKSVKVDPSLLQEDVDMVEDLIFMATKDCLDQIEKNHQGKNGSGNGWNAPSSGNVLLRINDANAKSHIG